MKKILLIIWAALAFAVLPATAAAVNSPELTYPTGTRLATSSAIRGVNVGETKLTSATSTVTCSTAKIEGVLQKNNGTEMEADIESASISGSAGGTCTSTVSSDVVVGTVPAKNGTPWCLRSTPELTEDEFQVRGGKCGESIRPIRIAVTYPTVVTECVYERSGTITGTYKTHPEDLLLTTNEVEFVKVSGAFTCPASTKLDTSLTFESDEGAGGPLYISPGPLLTFPTGTAFAVGSKIRGRNVGEVKMTSGTTLTCSAAEVTGTLKKNNGTEIEADIESASYSGTATAGFCTSGLGNVTWTFNSATNGLPWCLRATSKMAADEFQLRGNSCASASRPIRLVYETMAATSCLYERSAALAGSMTTHPEDAVLKFTDATFLEVEPKSASCPDETQLDSSLTLERNEAGTHPMYID